MIIEKFFVIVVGGIVGNHIVCDGWGGRFLDIDFCVIVTLIICYGEVVKNGFVFFVIFKYYNCFRLIFVNDCGVGIVFIL